MNPEGGFDHANNPGNKEGKPAALDPKFQQVLDKQIAQLRDTDLAEYLRTELTPLLTELASTDGDKEKVDQIVKRFTELTDDPKDPIIIRNIITKLLEVIANKTNNKKDKKEKDGVHLPEGPNTLLEQQGIKPGAVFYTYEKLPVLIKKVDPETSIVGFFDSKNVYYECTAARALETLTDKTGKTEDVVLELTRGKSLYGLSVQKPTSETHEGIDFDLGAKERPISIEVGEKLFDTRGNQWEIKKISDTYDNVILELEGSEKTAKIVVITDWKRQADKDTFSVLGGDISLSKDKPETEPEPTEYEGKELVLDSGTQGTFALEALKKYRDDDNVIWTVGKIMIYDNKQAVISLLSETGKVKKLRVASWQAYPYGVVVTDSEGKEHFFNPNLETRVTELPEQFKTKEDEEFDDTAFLTGLTEQELLQKQKFYQDLVARLNMLK